MIHQGKVHQTLTPAKIPRIKRKDVRDASTLGFRILNARKVVTLRNTSVKLTFIKSRKETFSTNVVSRSSWALNIVYLSHKGILKTFTQVLYEGIISERGQTMVFQIHSPFRKHL